jgi:hypothetical protein
MTKQELNKLKKGMKGLVEQDVLGITSTDVREMLVDWLYEVDEPELAKQFSREIYEYQVSPKIEKMQEDYNLMHR